MFAGSAMAKPQEILKSQGPSIKDVSNFEGARGGGVGGEGQTSLKFFRRTKMMRWGRGVSKKLEKNCRSLLWMVFEMKSEASFKAWEAFFLPSAAIRLA